MPSSRNTTPEENFNDEHEAPTTCVPTRGPPHRYGSVSSHGNSELPSDESTAMETGDERPKLKRLNRGRKGRRDGTPEAEGGGDCDRCRKKELKCVWPPAGDKKKTCRTCDKAKARCMRNGVPMGFRKK